MEAFQDPLTPEEERMYLIRCHQGDGEARNILIQRNMRLVAHISKKYLTENREMEDLISIGTIGLIKAIDTFDLERKSKLGTYAARCVENEILMFYRSNKRYAKDVSIYDPIGTDKEGNNINLVDVVPSKEKSIPDQVETKEEIRLMGDAMEAVLTEKEKTVIRMRYGLGNREEYTQREIAEQLHISRSYVSRIEKGALEKMRAYME
jgi:RNA polymerase sporulation-specific sigma factor